MFQEGNGGQESMSETASPHAYSFLRPTSFVRRQRAVRGEMYENYLANRDQRARQLARIFGRAAAKPRRRWHRTATSPPARDQRLAERAKAA